MTSAWAEVEGKGEGEGQKIDDGFPSVSNFDPIGDRDHVQDAEPLPQRRGGLNPKVVLAVFSVVMLAVVGFIAAKVYSALVPARAQEPAPIAAFTEQSVQEQQEQAPAEGQTILGSEAASDVAAAAASEPAASSTPPAAAQATAAAPAPQASVVDVASQGATIAAIQALDSSVNSKFAAVNKRMDDVEAKVASLGASGAAVKPSATATAKSGASHGQKPQARRPSAATSKAGKPAAKEEEKGATAVAESTEAGNYKLRAVYPPQGQDRQAWVIGKAGDVHTVVKGSTLAGMRVIRVEADQVVTDRGSIR